MRYRASAQSFAPATGLCATYDHYTYSGESGLSKLAGSAFVFGLFTTGIGVYELTRPEPDYRKDGAADLAIGVGGMGLSLLLAKWADDYERKHPERVYHSHYYPHERFFRTSKGFFRYSAANSDGQLGLACLF